jgi:hypothetical protein
MEDHIDAIKGFRRRWALQRIPLHDSPGEMADRVRRSVRVTGEHSGLLEESK